MEMCKIGDFSDAQIIRKDANQINVEGIYNVKCYDAEGNLRWEDTAKNLVTTVGKNYILNTGFRNNSYGAGFIGLISSVSYTAINVADTMASHAGWFEVSAATYFPTVAARLAASFGSDASSSSISTSAANFSIITNGGTVKGCFLAMGSGAVATLGNTGGILYSAGLFSGGDKNVGVGDTLSVTYTTSIT